MLDLIGREERSNCCIYRAPRRLRHENEKAFTRQVVSIGPIHHGQPHLEFMEEEKRRYLQHFRERTRLNVEELYYLIRGKEDTLCSCYDETIKFDSDAFVKIILVDAVFNVEFLLKHCFGDLPQKEDRIFGKPHLIYDVLFDMWLLENQIPFFILEEIFNLEKVSAAIPAIPQRPKPRFIELTYENFKFLNEVNEKLGKFMDSTNKVEVKHFLDFVRTSIIPSEVEQKEKKEKEKKVNQESKEKKRKAAIAPSAIQLLNAGANFKPSESNESFHINFKKGTLEIPPLLLQDPTESLFRNLIAFEQCHCSDSYINDYVTIIHDLANTPKDIELLVEKKIIKNLLPDKEGASTLLNKLITGVSTDPCNFYFSTLCEEMENYRAKSYNQWRAILVQNYFSTPWATLSVVAAVFVILLTVIQAVFSVLPVTNQQNACS
ncbi:UPF0481 protein At3g47200-like [Mangifera indica]|uniref:UPF0481 protein At3g47200-like n=1 Tax=Mangifera indica TaxID=29780 RepID=UPI001CFB9EA2|nr:UPF0481 protein At3g47200-like [Mangifera indica]